MSGKRRPHDGVISAGVFATAGDVGGGIALTDRERGHISYCGSPNPEARHRGRMRTNTSLGQDAQIERIAHLHAVQHTSIAVDQNVGVVWDVFKDIKRWYTEYTFDVIAGPSYDPAHGCVENQVIRVTSAHAFPRLPNAPESAGPGY